MTPRLRSRPRFSRWRPELVSLPPKGWDPHSNPDAGSADADSEDLDGEAESAFDRVASLERAERIDLASPFELGEIAYKQNLYEGHPGYRWTLQPGPPPPVVDWTVRSLIPLIDWQLELYNILAKQHQGASALVTNAAGHLGGHLIRSLEVARAFERHQRPLQWTLDAIRSQTQSAFSTAALVRLELESRSLEARWQGLDRVRDRKMLAGRICLLAAAAYRTGAVLLMGSKEGEAESYIGSIVEILEAAFALGGVDPSLLDDIALYDLTTAMWSASTPPEPRIFLSQRGPDYRSKLMVELAERGLIRDGARPGSRRFPWLGPIATAEERSSAKDEAPAAFFIDNYVPPGEETCRGFVRRELWECQHFHAFISQNYHQSIWCLTELRLWRVLSSLQPWRTGSFTRLVDKLDEGLRDLLPRCEFDTSTVLSDEVINYFGPIHAKPAVTRLNWLEFGMRRENQKYGDGGENVVWQKIAEVSHRAVIEIALRDRKALPSLRKSLIALLKVSITHEPGTDEALAATAAVAEAMPKHRSVAWIIYFLHDLLRFGRVRPVPTADILREAENYVTCAVEMDLLHSQAEAERLLALAYGEGIAYDSWVVRANTPEAEARVIIFGFVTGIARNNARLEQVRSELITGREIAGFRLGLLPSLTDDTWEEVLRLACRSAVGARLDGINALYQWGRYEELSSAAGALRADMRSGKVRFQPGDFGWVRFFEFIGLWRSGCYSRAYELAQTEEPVVYFLSTRNAGFLASVCTELAVRLNRPVNELITFGEQCVNHRDGDG